MTTLPFGRRRDHPPGQPPAPSRPPRTARFWAVVGATAVVILAAIGYGSLALAGHIAQDQRISALEKQLCSSMAPTDVVHGPGGECVGVTDGFFPIATAKSTPGLATVEKDIATEDKKVRDSGESYVSLAYLLPISADGAGVETPLTAVEQLEGAYAAQLYANENPVQGTAPQIQLLIASSGTNAAGYAKTDHILKQDVASQRLVAVAGVSISSSTSEKEIRDLTASGIPVIGSTITSDDFDSVTDLVRVAPSNAQEVRAALDYVRSVIKPTAGSVMLIEDTDKTDTYDTTLVHDFQAGLPASYFTGGSETYNTTGEVSPTDRVGQGVATRIGLMPTDICQAHPSVVLFGGRGRELGVLLDALYGRNCKSTPITIVTGDSVANMEMTGAVKAALAGTDNVRLLWAGEASGDEWSELDSATAYHDVPETTVLEGEQGFATFQGQFAACRFPGADEADGNAMMGWDASYTAVNVIRLATVGTTATIAGVSQDLNAIQGERVVYGASGPIDFSNSSQVGNAQGSSNPVGKVIPILKQLPGGPRFLALES